MFLFYVVVIFYYILFPPAVQTVANGNCGMYFQLYFFCSYIIIEKKINLIGLLHTNILLIQQK